MAYLCPYAPPAGWRQGLPVGGSQAVGGDDGFGCRLQSSPLRDEHCGRLRQPALASGVSASVSHEGSGPGFVRTR